MASTRRSPNYIEGLTAQSTITGQNEYLTSTNGVLNVGGGSGGGSTQYASGTTTPSPVTGNALIFDNSGTLEDVSVANPLPVSATLAAETTKVIGTVNQGTSPWVDNITKIGGANISLGQTTKSASLPVTLASDTGTLPVSDSAAESSLATIATQTAGLATSTNQTNGTQQTKLTDGTNLLSIATQGSTTSGQTGLLLQGAVNTSAPSYSNNQTSPLSLTNVGYLRVQARADAATGVAIPANAFMIGISDGTNLLAARTGLTDGNTSATLNTDLFIYNGTNKDRVRSANAASNTTGTGLLGTGLLGFDGTNYQRASVSTTGVQDVGLMPARTGLNTYSVHLTTNTTTTPTAATAYISSISISNEVSGTTSTVTIQDKQGTPLKLVNGLATTALTTAPTVINFQTPVKMVSGIDIVTAGAVAATIDVWINYYQ